MPNKLITFGFSGGVFAPEFRGRPDLEKYSLGLGDADNFVIDYRGGAFSRAGTEFLDPIPDAAAGVVLRRFRYNARIANTYIMIFTDQRLRFMQDGAYVLEAAKAVSGVVSGVVSSTAHGYSVGDLAKINGRLWKVSATTTNTFTIQTPDGAATTYSTGATNAYRVYTLVTPYAAADLRQLVFRQRRSDVLITHPSYAARTLTRTNHTSWSLTVAALGSVGVSAPSSLSATASGADSASIAYTVTAVDQNGKETPLAEIKTLASIVKYDTTAGSVTFTWNAAAGAKHYNVYRSIIFPAGAEVGQQLGYIGRSYGTSFVDPNITPDFTKTPPVEYDPFAPGAVDYIEVTNGGTGYTNPTVSVSGGGGSGFSGLVLSRGGVITGVLVLNRGSGYSSPSVSFTGGGSGAAATARLTPASGTYPSVGLFFKSRLWLMGSEAFPLRLTASRPEGDLFNFNFNQIANAADPLILDIDSDELTPIRYGEIVNDSIFILTDQSVWQVATQDANYVATLRTTNGVGLVPPLTIGREMLYALARGTGIWALKPSNLPNYYVDADVSLYSSHLFSPDDPVISWAFAREPYRVIWAATESGRLLSCTYVSEQNVYAWASHSTKGQVLAVETLEENGRDFVYLVVLRDGMPFVERMRQRDFATTEDIWSVDCALTNVLPNPAASLSVDGDTCVASAGVFAPADVGSHVRAGGGRGEITGYTSATKVTVRWDMPITETAPQESTPPVFAEGEWSLAPRMNTFSGLDHLEGREVEIFADGNIIGRQTVIDGAVTFAEEVSKAIIGLPFTGFIELLPLVASDTIIEDRRKRIVEITVRTKDTRGLEYEVDGLRYPMKERTTENIREPTRFQSGPFSLTALAEWRTEPQVRIWKIGAGCVSVQNIIVNLEIGDDG